MINSNLLGFVGVEDMTLEDVQLLFVMEDSGSDEQFNSGFVDDF